jgi:hypothetical protein
MAISANTMQVDQATNDLADLIASHRAMMTAHEALYDNHFSATVPTPH